MYTLYITWPGQNWYSIMDNITILLLRVESQWTIKTESSKEYSHLELIGVQHECDNISMMSLVMFSDG